MANMLDISIKNIDKIFKKDTQIETFLNSEITIEEKTDGVKLTLLRKKDKWDSTNILNNFIVSYKNNILVSSEFMGIDRPTIKKSSIGISQFAFVFDLLNRIPEGNLKQIPTSTEFFIEYLIDKPTLTRNYKNKHSLILIAYSPTKYKLTQGRVFTKPSGFFQVEKELIKYSNLLNIDLPLKLFKGVPNTFKNLKAGSLHKMWDKQLSISLPLQNMNTWYDKFNSFKQFVLSIESIYGGKTEGVVIKQGNNIYKVLQADQHDKITRNAKKQLYKMDPDEENKYWDELYIIADDIIKNKLNYNAKYDEILGQLNNICYNWTEFPKHTKRSGIKLQDDLFETAKTKLMRRLPGNNNALFIGRLQPPTAMHMKIIETGLQTYDNVVIGLVKSKTKKSNKNPFTFETQVKIIKEKFPDVEIVQVGNGNIIGIIQKIQENINVVLAGSDRVDGYKKQLERQLDMHVEETKRDYSGVSGTKARESLVNNDFPMFKQNMDQTTWQYFEELRNELMIFNSLKEHFSFKKFLSLRSK